MALNALGRRIATLRQPRPEINPTLATMPLQELSALRRSDFLRLPEEQGSAAHFGTPRI
ncbi:hypothetical protein D3C77_792190 [compost metagenome]